MNNERGANTCAANAAASSSAPALPSSRRTPGPTRESIASFPSSQKNISESFSDGFGAPGFLDEGVSQALPIMENVNTETQPTCQALAELCPDADVNTVVGALIQAATHQRELQTKVALALSHPELAGYLKANGGKKPADWYAGLTNINPVPLAHQIKAVTKVSTELPQLDAALRSGEMSAEQVTLVGSHLNDRNVVGLREEQEQIILMAKLRPSFEAFRRYVKREAERHDESGDDYKHDPKEDFLRVFQKRNGRTGVIGDYCTANAAQLVQQLNEQVRDDLYSREKDAKETKDLPVPSHDNLMAHALIERMQRGKYFSVDGKVKQSPSADVLLVARAESGLSGITTTNDVKLSDETIARVTCDAVWTTIITNYLGNPLDAGKEQRLATELQRRALKVRDGHCIFPSCDKPFEMCEAHHVQHYEHNGKTVMENLVLLCKYHHGVVHSDGWKLRAHIQPPWLQHLIAPTDADLDNEIKRRRWRKQLLEALKASSDHNTTNGMSPAYIGVSWYEFESPSGQILPSQHNYQTETRDFTNINDDKQTSPAA